MHMSVCGLPVHVRAAGALVTVDLPPDATVADLRAAAAAALRYPLNGWALTFAGQVLRDSVALADCCVGAEACVDAAPPPRLVRCLAGVGASRQPLASVEVFDTAAAAWTAAQPMPTARAHLAVVESSGRLFAIGGTD
eukprot:gene5579-10115_t